MEARRTGLVNSLRRGMRRAPSAQALSAAGWGGLAGIYLVTWVQQWIATFGISPPARTAIVTAVAAAVTLGAAFRGKAGGCGWTSSAGILSPAAWTIAYPALLGAAGFVMSRLPTTAVAATFGWFAVALTAGLLLVGLPVLALALADFPPAAVRPSRRSEALAWLGFGGGVMFDVALAAPLMGVQTTGVLAASVGAFLYLRRAFGARAAPPPGNDAIREHCGEAGAISALPGLAASLCGGMAFAAMSAMFTQLMPATGFAAYAQWAALAAGLGLARGWRSRPQQPGEMTRRTAAWPCLLGAAWSAVFLVAFSALVWLMLWLNSEVMRVELALAGRFLLMFAAVAPLGFAWGRTVVCGPEGPASVCWHPAVFAAGHAAAVWLAVPNLGAAAALLAAGSLWLALGALQWWGGAVPVVVRLRALRSGVSPQQRVCPAGSLRASLAARVSACCAKAIQPPIWAGAVLLAAWAAGSGRDTAVPTARLLFSTNAFLAYRSGVPRELLPAIDAARPTRECSGRCGTYTLWKYGPGGWEIRLDGVPVGAASTAPRTFPQASGEILPAVLPLVLHPRPRHVLLLGLGSGEVARTCLRFPVLSVTCWEADKPLREIVREEIWSRLPHNPQADARLRIRGIDAVAAIRTEADAPQQFDVIASCPPSPVLLEASPAFTVEWYRGVQRRLFEGGIFCQRFQQSDFGPAPAAVVAATLQAVFQHVLAFETGPGELVFVASDGRPLTSGRELIDRLERRHVREVLADVGWDWSVILNLDAYDGSQLAAFAAAHSAEPNTVGSSRLAFNSWWEMLRWSPKWQERLEALSGHRSRLLEWVGDAGADPRVLRRLAEVAGARRLMVESPDEWWHYRRELREQIRSIPAKTLIQQATFSAGHVPLPPEAQRRMDYLQALSAAVTDGATAEEVARLADFAEPFDPLLSYFLHHEVARLAAGSSECDRCVELAHRLAAVFHADPRDRSVRDVAAALRLLAEHPESLAGQTERFDQLNALLQALKHRWDNRAATAPRNVSVGLNDLSQSIAAAEAALTEMDRLAEADSGIAEWWPARRRYLEHALIGPLRTYRDQLLPHSRKIALER